MADAPRTRLRLTDGVIFEVDAPAEEIARALSIALDTATLFEIENAAGILRSVNPWHVIYVEPIHKRTVPADG